MNDPTAPSLGIILGSVAGAGLLAGLATYMLRVRGNPEGVPNLLVVLSHGWVLAGEVASWDNENLILRRGAVVRRWGTTRGLGEIVGGPITGSQIDPIPSKIVIPTHSIVYTIDADAAWDPYFEAA